MLLPHLVCNALVAVGRLLGAEQQAMRPGWGKLCDLSRTISLSRPPATKASHTICGNNTSIVLSSWWWAYKCPKHVEKTIIFFFFNWRYNPWWVLACFTILFHNPLSLHFSLQFLTFILFNLLAPEFFFNFSTPCI